MKSDNVGLTCRAPSLSGFIDPPEIIYHFIAFQKND